MRLIYDFSNRAEECMRLAERAHTSHDKQFFVDLARAWYGVAEADVPQAAPQPSRPH